MGLLSTWEVFEDDRERIRSQFSFAAGCSNSGGQRYRRSVVKGAARIDRGIGGGGGVLRWKAREMGAIEVRIAEHYGQE